MIELRIKSDDGHVDRVDAPEDLSARELVEECLHARHRPYLDAAGHPLPWRLEDGQTGTVLQLSESLEQNGIHHGQELNLSLVRGPHSRESVLCEKCHRENEGGAPVCSYCGPVCSYCGSKLGPTSDLKLEITAPDGRSHHAVLPSNTQTQEFLAGLVEVFGLPKTEIWELFESSTSRILDPHKTLVENGISSEHRLRLQRQNGRGGKDSPRQDLKLDVAAPDDKSHSAILPPDTQTQDFLADLVEIFGLADSEDWELFQPSTNRILNQHKTLAENGVASGQRLLLRKKKTPTPVEWEKIAIIVALIAAVAVIVVIGPRIINYVGQIVTPAVAVNIEPKGPVRLSPSKAQKFSATVEHGKTRAVRWFIEPAVGFVSSEGVYTAPSSVTSPQTVMVIAQSQDDPRRSATASITLVPPPIRVDPPTVTLGPNQSAQFTVEPAELSVELAEQLEVAVDWSLDPAVGTITAAGVYTSPAHIQEPQTVTLIARSKTDPTNSARATISLTQSPVAQLTISPKRVSLDASKKLQFKTTLNPNTGGAILWSADPVIGNISQEGLYSAPGLIPAGRQVRVTATLSTESNISAVATVTLVPVAVTPISAAVNGTQVQLHATVMHASNTGVTWSINPQIGSISAQGLYTPPSPISEQLNITATATSQSDSTKSSTFMIHLVPKVAITLNPYKSVLTNSEQQMLSATVTGTQNRLVTWKISGPGTILPNGSYTAPATIPPVGETVLINVTSNADPNQHANGEFRLTPNTERPQRFRVSQGVAQGLLIHEVTPVYPPLARSQGIQGTVVLQALIAKDGTVRNLQVVSGPPTLINSALQAVSQWRYRPYYLNGEAMEAETTINVVFTLHQ